MSQLNNLYISSSYQGLLKLTDSTNGLTNTLQTVQSGDGSDSPLQMSLTDINISGSFYVNGNPVIGSTSGSSGTSGTSGSNGTDGSSGTSGSSGTGFTYKSVWDNATTYNSYDVVSYNGQSYVALSTNTNKQPSIWPAIWSVFSASGSSGTSGSNGSSGTSGVNGTSGSNGSSGTSGNSGTNGSSGSSGSNGSSGTSGSNGSNGSSGTSGSSGSNGSSGTSGINGSNGTSGVNGTDGSSGTSGSNGTDGTSGSNGTDGSSGTSGTVDYTGLITTGSIGQYQSITGSIGITNIDNSYPTLSCAMTNYNATGSANTLYLTYDELDNTCPDSGVWYNIYPGQTIIGTGFTGITTDYANYLDNGIEVYLDANPVDGDLYQVAYVVSPNVSVTGSVFTVTGLGNKTGSSQLVLGDRNDVGYGINLNDIPGVYGPGSGGSQITISNEDRTAILFNTQNSDSSIINIYDIVGNTSNLRFREGTENYFKTWLQINKSATSTPNPVRFLRNTEITGSLKISNSNITVNAGSVGSTALIVTGAILLSGSINNMNFWRGPNDNGTQVGIGGNSLQKSISGSFNLAIGGGALQDNISGSNNVALGTGTLNKNLAPNNVGVGSQALTVNTLGTGNTAIGANAMFYNTIGNGNVAIGGGALNNNISGSNNVAIGNNTLQNNVADFNLALGAAALSANTTGQYNVAIGQSSNQANTIGQKNTVIGWNGLVNNVTGSTNTAIGTQALQNNNGSGNVAIGYAAGFNSTSSNEFFVGNDNYGTVNNERSGSLFYGKFNATPSNQTLQINAATNITNNLVVSGSLTVSGSIQSTAGFGQVELLTNQTLPSSVDTVITFNNDEFDPSGWYNSEYFYYQPTIAGIYQISYSVNFEPATAGAGQVNVQIAKDNGMDINQLAINQHELNLLSNTSLTGTVFAQLDGNLDKLYLTAYSSVGQDVNGGNGTYLNIKLL